jgi:hypothetical protein
MSFDMSIIRLIPAAALPGLLLALLRPARS